MEPLLEIRRLTKRFGDRVVLDRISLVIERGETVVIIGGSGSGKTTLARIIVGLEHATSGRIIIDGRDLSELDHHTRSGERARFAMVFQKYALLDSLNVYDNVAFPLREHTHLPEDEVARRVTGQLEALGLEDAASKLPAELSGGMAKRVGIARAMVMKPELLVYDEPTSGLDPVTSRMVDDLIEEVREKFCVTSIVITHDMATAYGIADRVVLLQDGKIVAEGPPQEVLSANEGEIHVFAESSGIDPERLHPRAKRTTPDEIRARWAESR